ncbi:hypothetical protein B0H19DRAFT_1067418 [Mycena capillaripes]|nr:hypothetical protein B0H19DRAFT_1067418 [Mycena capillaripes]
MWQSLMELVPYSPGENIIAHPVGNEHAEGASALVTDEIKANYEKDVTAEFWKPIIVDGDAGRINGWFRFLSSAHFKDIETTVGAETSFAKSRSSASLFRLSHLAFKPSVPKLRHFWVDIIFYSFWASLRILELSLLLS